MKVKYKPIRNGYKLGSWKEQITEVKGKIYLPPPRQRATTRRVARLPIAESTTPSPLLSISSNRFRLRTKQKI